MCGRVYKGVGEMLTCVQGSKSSVDVCIRLVLTCVQGSKTSVDVCTR